MEYLQPALMIALGIYLFYAFFTELRSVIRFSGILLGSIFIFRGLSVIFFNLQIINIPFILLILFLLSIIILLNKYNDDIL